MEKEQKYECTTKIKYNGFCRIVVLRINIESDFSINYLYNFFLESFVKSFNFYKDIHILDWLMKI